MVEEAIQRSRPPAAKHASRGAGVRSTLRRLTDIGGEVDERLPTSINELGRVLGGGVVPGSIVLIGGDPGIGKSTLLLQMSLDLARKVRVLYVSGEEFRAPDQNACPALAAV